MPRTLSFETHFRPSSGHRMGSDSASFPILSTWVLSWLTLKPETFSNFFSTARTFFVLFIKQSRKQAYRRVQINRKMPKWFGNCFAFNFSANYDENIYHICHVLHCNPALLILLYEQSDWSAQHTSWNIVSMEKKFFTCTIFSFLIFRWIENKLVFSSGSGANDPPNL